MTTANMEQKIKEGITILKSIGMPSAQQNDRSALCLLALLDLQADEKWSNSKSRLIGITPIMKFAEDYYNQSYKPNTRETFRRQSMHQFVDAGVALYNPDNKNRPVNSPKAVYQIEDETLELIRTFNTEKWEAALIDYLKDRKTLVEQYAKEREQNKVSLVLDGSVNYSFSMGKHSELIKDIIEEFGPRFVPGGMLLYAGDTGAKSDFYNKKMLKELGIEVDIKGKMPDVIIYYPKKKWLIVIEAVTSHGPVDSKRHNELSKLFKSSKVGIVYVSAFPDKKLMSRYITDISWETEVWIADAPSHLIHLNGVRFLGPY